MVVTRLLLDSRNHAWGKWRPSREARRIGTVAVDLERLRRRDGFNRDERDQAMALRHPALSVVAVREIEARLPVSLPRRAIVDAAVAHLSAPASPPDVHVSASERSRDARMIHDALRGAFCALPREDRRLLRLRFREGMSVVAIAKANGLEQRELYRRFDRILRTLRHALERNRVTSLAAADVIGRHDVEVAGALEDWSGLDARRHGPNLAAPCVCPPRSYPRHESQRSRRSPRSYWMLTVDTNRVSVVSRHQ